MIRVRAEQPDDRTAVFDVNERAFGHPDEARLVEALRGEVDPFVSLVAVEDDRVVGHALFTPVTVDDGVAPWTAMALGPIAVAPERQRRGVGSALIRAGLDACADLGHEVVFVLGATGYYSRFGFAPASTCGLRCPPWDTDAFQVLELVPGALAGRRGDVSYHQAFEGLS